MYGFLILLPLTLISLVVGWLIAASPQIADYVEYFTEIPEHTDRLKEILANRQLWAQTASHVLAYSVLCFVLLATVRTISAPLPSDRPALLRSFQLFLEVVFVGLPSTVLLWISGRSLLRDWNNWIHWFAIGILCIGLLTSIVVTVRRRPLELYGSFNEPFRTTKTDVFAALSAVLIVATIVAFALYPRDSARAVGMFPVLMLATTVIFLGVAAIFSRHSSPVAIISSLISAVLLLQILDQALQPGREFRYRNIALPAGAGPSVTVSEVMAQRKIPDLTTAFYQWLEHRRPAIEEYRKKGRAYPVFFVSAQGGGMYAAYHPALSLARLTDYCPEFAHHLFGISSVSGGSLGAAVFAELMRQVPPAERGNPAPAAVGCSRLGDPSTFNFLQRKVQAFFQTDFLSPVISSAVLFDLPGLVVPQLRLGPDRARALESGFEAAWNNLGLSGAEPGLSGDFFERWEPTGPAPALFMSTTGVNFGIPVLISQVDWSFNPLRGMSVKGPKKGAEAALLVPDSELEKTILERLQNPDDQLQVGIANLLDFRPDVQLSTSTAVVLSARFPFVTPPGTIKRNDKISIARGAIFQKIKVLELTDGGFYDNSGSIVARDIIRELSRGLDNDDRLKPFKNDIRFHLIRFTDTPARRQALAKEGANFEFVSPLAAYDAVRLARGVFLANPPRTAISNVYLLDEWYEGTLNWLLSRDTKVNIEKRSSWIAFGNEVCCEVRHSAVPNVTKRIPLSPEQVEQLQRADHNLSLKNFIPNADDFLRVMRLLNEGVPVPPSQSSPAAAPANP
jgi:hypothetical protein